MLKPISHIELLLKADCSDWKSTVGTIKDKRFGQAEGQSQTVHWLQSQDGHSVQLNFTTHYVYTILEKYKSVP